MSHSAHVRAGFPMNPHMAEPAEERSFPFGRFQICAVGGHPIGRTIYLPSFSSQPPRAMVAGLLSPIQVSAGTGPGTRQVRAAIVACPPRTGRSGAESWGCTGPARRALRHPGDVLILAGTAALLPCSQASAGHTSGSIRLQGC